MFTLRHEKKLNSRRFAACFFFSATVFLGGMASFPAGVQAQPLRLLRKDASDSYYNEQGNNWRARGGARIEAGALRKGGQWGKNAKGSKGWKATKRRTGTKSWKGIKSRKGTKHGKKKSKSSKPKYFGWTWTSPTLKSKVVKKSKKIVCECPTRDVVEPYARRIVVDVTLAGVTESMSPKTMEKYKGAVEKTLIEGLDFLNCPAGSVEVLAVDIASQTRNRRLQKSNKFEQTIDVLISNPIPPVKNNIDTLEWPQEVLNDAGNRRRNLRLYDAEDVFLRVLQGYERSNEQKCTYQALLDNLRATRDKYFDQVERVQSDVTGEIFLSLSYERELSEYFE